MSKTNDGKAAEALVREWLKARSEQDAKLAWHRLPDARAARGALAAQPSDFYVVNRGVFSHLEVKSTEQKTRLHRSKVSQYGALKSFHLAGGKCFVLVEMTYNNRWVILDNDILFPETDDTIVSFPLTTGMTYSNAQAALNDIYPRN